MFWFQNKGAQRVFTMEFKDYYAILGLSPDVDDKTIKATYRKLARQHHPDVNPGDKAAEDKFKEINEAYQALSNPEQRKKYDELRAQYLRWQQTGGRRPGGFAPGGQPGAPGPQDFDWQAWAAQPGEGPGVYYASAEDLEDLFGAADPYSDFFTTIFGQARGQRPASPRPRRGQDLEAEVEVSLEEALHGATRLIDLGERRGERRIEARIPPGVRTGSRIRLAGQGQPGRAGAGAGDLYLVIRLLAHPTFEVEGDDLHAELPVDVYTAVVGGEVSVPTLERPVLLKIPPLTDAGRVFRLRGKGLPRLGNPESRGDLFARARLVLPENLNEQERQTFQELAAARKSGEPVS